MGVEKKNSKYWCQQTEDLTWVNSWLVEDSELGVLLYLLGQKVIT